ncbi:hypothetical protein CPB86DRAFT_389523 [Serendipita vermifera]|nr:hypothetical protein CPB86DRAFT_389523 [Serendipita vermifera]
MASSPGRAGNYLSIDGGVNPLSALYIIDEMLQRLKFDIGSEDDIRACDWFDLIIGSGHGGLIALLIGRLQMNTIQAIKAYNSLAAVLATEPTDSKEDRELNMARFVDSFKRVLIDAGYPVDTPMRIGAKQSSPCKVGVCALDPLNAISCQFIRSYATRGMDDPQCTILQAACVAIASPDAYDPIMVGEEDDNIAYIDAMTGYANPTNEVLKEAEKVFGKNAIVATIVSLGSGKPERRQQQQEPITMQLNDILRRTIWDIERVHNDVQNRFQDLGIYHRFNVEDPLPSKESTKQTTKAHAKAYLQEPFTIRRMDQAINSVRERKGVMILKDLNTISSVERKYRQRPGVVPFFIGRQDVLDHLHQTHIQTPEGEYPIISVLIGLGGSGKTQIALQFARQFESM